MVADAVYEHAIAERDEWKAKYYELDAWSSRVAKHSTDAATAADAAEARVAELEQALRRIRDHEMVQSHPYGGFCIDVARAALGDPS